MRSNNDVKKEQTERSSRPTDSVRTYHKQVVVSANVQLIY